MKPSDLGVTRDAGPAPEAIRLVRPPGAVDRDRPLDRPHPAMKAVEQSPILAITSPVKQSGKSRLLDVIETVVPTPWRIERPSEAVLFRRIARETPTVLMDEADTVFEDRKGQYEGTPRHLQRRISRQALVGRQLERSQPGPAAHPEQVGRGRTEQLSREHGDDPRVADRRPVPDEPGPVGHQPAQPPRCLVGLPHRRQVVGGEELGERGGVDVVGLALGQQRSPGSAAGST